MKIGIINHGMGNIQSVYNAFKYLKVGVEFTRLRDIEKFSAIVLPGVGAFKDTAILLDPYKKNIQDFLSSGKSFLGICVGLQYLFEKSFENGEWNGLGYFKDQVRKLPEKKLPQIGWNKIIVKRKNPLLRDISSGSYVYYINSYAASEKYALATSFYGKEFAAIVADGNVFGTQFHPEKSGKVGLKILNNFIEVTKNASNSKC
jgi:glutamine amidotransferase